MNDSTRAYRKEFMRAEHRLDKPLYACPVWRKFRKLEGASFPVPFVTTSQVICNNSLCRLVVNNVYFHTSWVK